ncbi:hypothetical protein RBH26_18635 [Natronolimnohabitans sp. A-GB9]|uniref:hypothetical protein n=1 Tax=Natronolimnohabitans sp. A-GB9 TaxID=3069757 RepID=UPI0027AE7507|nr:hypothetical protein [Natronolimnohabitans sp. A-GB9]MDQ2052484.1 hypothetical protein [Natronolimnohabitans sp. A-GB9]
MTSPPSTSRSRPPGSPKAVLHCFDCGHESHIDGDWIVRETDGCIVYRCPDCETTISVRPRSSNACERDGADGLGYCIGD